jgi:hypothetical protein
MKNAACRLKLFVLLPLALVSLCFPFALVNNSNTANPPALPKENAPQSNLSASRIRQAYGNLPLYFIENRGQTDSRVGYYSQGAESSVYFTRHGVTFSLADTASDLAQVSHRRERRREISTERWKLKLDFIDSNPDLRLRGADKAPAIVSYFKGNQSDGPSEAATYSTVVYEDVWPGIDLLYTGTESRLKYTFFVKPGADPNQIKLAYRGADSVFVNGEDQLEITTPLGSIRDDKPYSYQESGEQQIEIATRYEVSDSAANVYGFQVGEYDRSKPLVIDPVILTYCGYIGGAGFDVGQDITVDADGNAYVTGTTRSLENTFPELEGPDRTFNGNSDAFVAKINPSGTALIYCGYIGGVADDAGIGVAVDTSGNAYVLGNTSSTEATFPILVGPDLTHNGSRDAFVAKVNPQGTALIYCGFIGGFSFELTFGGDIAVDSTGNVYVTGDTGSNQTTFPVTIGPDLTFNGITDVFVAKLNASGTALAYCGYIGGEDGDSATAIALDGDGNIYVTGDTESDESSFPVAVGPDLTHNGESDAFVAKLNPLGTALTFCGYIGGAADDFTAGIGLDSTGNIYVGGDTDSQQNTFPVRVGPDLTYGGGETDAYVAKIAPSGITLLYCGYIGGAEGDFCGGLAVNAAGNAYLFGDTDSTQTSFPVLVGPDLTHNGSCDAFIAKVNVAGTGLAYCGYIGGIDDDFGFSGAIAVDSEGNAYVTGDTDSVESSFPETAGPVLTFSGASDAFVAKIIEQGSFALSLGQEAVTVARGRKFKVTVNVTHAAGFTSNVTISGSVASTPGVKFKPKERVSVSGQSVKFTLKVTAGASVGTHQVVFTGRGPGGEQQSTTLTLTIQ